MKQKPICNACGSDDIYCDAYGAWDAETGTWELAAQFCDYVCNGCDDMDAQITWVELTCENTPSIVGDANKPTTEIHT